MPWLERERKPRERHCVNYSLSNDRMWWWRWVTTYLGLILQLMSFWLKASFHDWLCNKMSCQALIRPFRRMKKGNCAADFFTHWQFTHIYEHMNSNYQARGDCENHSKTNDSVLNGHVCYYFTSKIFVTILFYINMYITGACSVLNLILQGCLQMQM